MKVRALVILTTFILIVAMFLTWRWFLLPQINIPKVEIALKDNLIAHPLDVVIQKHLYQIGVSAQLLQQFVQPALIVSIEDMAVQRCEVSQGSFRRFSHWRASQINPPAPHPKQPQNWEYRSLTQDHQFLGQLKVPAGGLSFYDAFSYCNAIGGRLPTSYEFQAVASKQPFALYPWGNDFNNSAWQYQDASLNVAEHCDAQPQHATQTGIQGLGTNLSEWTTTGGAPTLMGGNAYQRPYELFALNVLRRYAAPDFRSNFTGFRCVFPNSGTTTVSTPWNEVLEVVPIAKSEVKVGVDPKAKLPALFKHLETINMKTLESFALASKYSTLEMTQYEIRVADYKIFLRDPLVWLGFYNHPKQPDNITHKPKQWQRQIHNKNSPVNHISWWNAWAFAHWLGGRLPYAHEWQKIASSNATLYPYGNNYTFLRSIDRNRLASQWQPLEVSESNDSSVHNIFGLTGNVSEWTNSTVLRGASFNIVVKGGSFYKPEDAGRVSYSAEAPPNYSSDDLGFRVVFEKKINSETTQ